MSVNELEWIRPYPEPENEVNREVSQSESEGTESRYLDPISIKRQSTS